MLELEEHFQRAQVALARRPPAELAAFILSLADAQGVGCYVQAFAVADVPAAVATVLRLETQILRQGQGSYSFRERLGLDWGCRAMRLLDAIEAFILPRDRTIAADLLELFIMESERIVANCRGDEESGKLVKRAYNMLGAL